MVEVLQKHGVEINTPFLKVAKLAATAAGKQPSKQVTNLVPEVLKVVAIKRVCCDFCPNRVFQTI